MLPVLQIRDMVAHSRKEDKCSFWYPDHQGKDGCICDCYTWGGLKTIKNSECGGARPGMDGGGIPVGPASESGTEVSKLPDHLSSAAHVPNHSYSELAQKTRDEDWGHGDDILKNYMKFTFRFLVTQQSEDVKPMSLPLFDRHKGSKIVHECLVFDTGLASKEEDSIYGVMKPNKNHNAQPYWLVFMKSTDFDKDVDKVCSSCSQSFPCVISDFNRLNGLICTGRCIILMQSRQVEVTKHVTKNTLLTFLD